MHQAASARGFFFEFMAGMAVAAILLLGMALAG